jgi:hypothetical protein
MTTDNQCQVQRSAQTSLKAQPSVDLPSEVEEQNGSTRDEERRRALVAAYKLLLARRRKHALKTA